MYSQSRNIGGATWAQSNEYLGVYISDYGGIKIRYFSSERGRVALICRCTHETNPVQNHSFMLTVSTDSLFLIRVHYPALTKKVGRPKPLHAKNASPMAWHSFAQCRLIAWNKEPHTLRGSKTPERLSPPKQWDRRPNQPEQGLYPVTSKVQHCSPGLVEEGLDEQGLQIKFPFGHIDLLREEVAADAGCTILTKVVHIVTNIKKRRTIFMVSPN